MTPQALELARRLAAHPRFRWAPGMLETQGARCLGADPTEHDQLVFADRP